MVEIRNTTAVDGERLREIQQTTLAEPWPELLETALDGYPPLFVATDPDPVGYGIVIPGPEETAYVPELAIASDRQRSGYGTALVDTIGSAMRTEGYDRLALTARADDEDAQAFYRANGFTVEERLPEEYESGAGLLFVRELR